MALSRRLLVGFFGIGSLVAAACVGDEPAAGNDDGGASDATTGGDGSAGDDAAKDAATGPCNLDAPFETPVLVAGLPITNSVVRLSQDELTAYFAMQLIDDGGPFSLYQATRPDKMSPFGTPTPLDALNDDAGESDPAVSVDGHDIIYVHSYGPPASGGARDIWRGARTSLDASFANPMRIATGGVNVDAVQDDYPSLATNDDLWFVSVRGDGGQAIYQATSAGGTDYSTVAAAANINAPGAKQYYPVLTSTRLRIYYNRDQTLYTATRASTSDDFSNPSNVAELNTALPGLRPGWVSPDDCRLYMTVGSPQTAYVASKPAN